MAAAASSTAVATMEPAEEPDRLPLCDFLWTDQEEPHKTRRLMIMAKYPKVSALCGPEPLTKYIAAAVVCLQLAIALGLRNTPVWSARFLLTAYLVGATANQNLFLAIHEIAHNMAFKTLSLNRYFSVFVNLPIGVPYSAAFRPYHLDHHKFLGQDGIDTDLPTRLEALFLQNVLGKAFFCTFQIVFYAIRPIFIKRQPFTAIHVVNILAQATLNFLLVHYFGWKPLVYLLVSSFLAGSLHPCAAHFIAEHYTLNAEPGPSGKIPRTDTYSYYGWLNIFCYNVGYHNEHHDFPYIPWSRLPKLRTLAKEFYEQEGLPWTLVMWTFIFDSKCLGMWGRVKRVANRKV